MAETNKLERMNYFRGFLTTAEDWRAEQKYHRDKHRLHNEWQHATPGIVRGYPKEPPNELAVMPVESPPPAENAVQGGDAPGGEGAPVLQVRVLPGAAIDIHGNMLVLDAPLVRSLPRPPEGSPESLVYIAIRYLEREADWLDNFEQPDYSGYKRIREYPAAVVVTTDAPDNQELIELARVRIQSGATGIGAPEAGQPAGVNQVDRGQVHWVTSISELLEQLAALRGQLAEANAALAELRGQGTRLLRGYGWLNYYRLLHSQGLGTPGVIQGLPEGLKVEPAGGTDVRVLPGAAIDAHGNVIELHTARVLHIDMAAYKLPDTVFVVARCEGGYNPEQTGDEAGPGFGETVALSIETDKPNNATGLELARINLVDPKAPITAADDPDHAGANQVDLRHVKYAGAVGIRDPEMEPETRDRVIQAMHRTRRDFAALGARFPVPSEGDVRHACLTVETVLRVGRVRPGVLPQTLRALAIVQRDVGQELAEKYGEALRSTKEYKAYMDAVRDLETALQRGNEGELLNAVEALAAAARELSEVVVETPVAEAGGDLHISTPGEETIVTLNGAGSWSRGGRAIETYTWRRVEG